MSAPRLVQGDCREVLAGLPDASVQCCVTSPPYWGLRDYGVAGQLGLEKTPEEYVASLVSVFREVRRVLKGDGTLWLNLGDSYAAQTKGSGGTGKSTLVGTPNDGNGQLFAPRSFVLGGLKPKDLVGIPWRVAFALQADGWYLRSDIIWAKPNPMPESVRDRPTKAHEYLFLLAKSERYFYDAEAAREPFANGLKGATPWGKNERARNRGGRTDGLTAGTGTGWVPSSTGRNRRTVWTVTPKPFKGAHFATMPPALVEPCVLAGSRPGDVVLDPFAGAGTTGLMALQHGRDFLGVELNGDYVAMAKRRLAEAEPVQAALAWEAAG